jgi:adenosylmethionine-8-amino-7-oxononanoate aminotransferase
VSLTKVQSSTFRVPGSSQKRGTRNAERLAVLDKRYVWHPFTQQTEWAHREPVVIDSADGVWLKDIRGRRFIDGVSSLWVNVWGHRRPEIDRAIQKQLRKIAHTTFLGLTHEPAIQLAKRLVDVAPHGLSRVFYSDNGSTAVEVALKMAYQYWQLKGQRTKTKFVSLGEGYHGDTLGSVSVGGIDLFHARFKDLLFGGFAVQMGNFEQIEKLLKDQHARIAAMIVEPLIQGASGMRLMPKGYLSHVARLCKRHNVLLIADEVATGFGRTGTMFAVEQEKVRPDFLCVAKSITAGYLPLAATLSTEKVYRAFLGCYDEFKAFFHGHTYTANPLACAAALANLELYRKENLLAKIQQRSKQLAESLAPLRDHPHVKEVRQVGLMMGIELIEDKAKAKGYPPAARMGLNVCDDTLKRGVWLRPLGDIVVLMPPLAISAKELQFLVDTVILAINEVTATAKRLQLRPLKAKTQI